MLRIGIDFDNTIVDYRPVLASAARELSIFEPPPLREEKREFRDHLRARPNGEADWQRLQAHVYGVAIVHAPAFKGVNTFLDEARRRGAGLFVVSHKSRFAAAAPDGPDLQAAARAWLSGHGIAVDRIYFEATREAKIERIGDLGLSHFIDDLEDVLADPAFPVTTRGIHFRNSWEAVLRDVFG